MRNKIAKTSNGHCLERALSTMRLALGYETGLPKNWNKRNSKSIEDIIKLLPEIFPERSIMVWVDTNTWWNLIDADSKVVLFKGIEFEGGLDNFLTAFIYNVENDESHIVIGEPVYGDAVPLEITLIFAVEI